jgi:hypothetical protein
MSLDKGHEFYEIPEGYAYVLHHPDWQVKANYGVCWSANSASTKM